MRTRDHAYIPVPVDTRREFVDHVLTIPLNLEPVDIAKIEARVFQSEPGLAGLEQLCQEITESHDPQVIHILLYLANNRFKLEQYFLPHSTTNNKSQIETTIVKCLENYFKTHPELFTLFATEFYKQDPNQFRNISSMDRWYDLAYFFILQQYEQDNRAPALQLSREQFEHLVDSLIAHCAGSNAGNGGQDIQAQFISRFDPEYAARKITVLLHDAADLSPTAENSLVGLLSCLDVSPATIQDDRCYYLGTQIQLNNLPAGAVAVERLSIYGDVAVMNAAGEIIGGFSMHALQPAAQHTFRALVRELELDDLFFQTQAEGGLSRAEKVDLADEFKTAYHRYANDQFFKICHRPLNTFPLKEQVGLIKLLRSDDIQLIKGVQRCVYQYGPNILRALAIVQVYDGNLRNIMTVHHGPTDMLVLKAALEPIVHSDGQQLSPLDYFVDFVQRAEAEAGVLYLELQHQFPDITLNVEDVSRGLIKHAQEGLMEIHDTRQAIEYCRDLEKQATEATLALIYFREMIGVGEKVNNDAPIHLEDYHKRQRALVELIKSPTIKILVIELLLRLQLLKPIPEIHWRVDRTTADCHRRLGLNVSKLITSSELQVLELGPGSGQAKADRQQAMAAHEFALADHLYYSVEHYIEQVLDFDSIARSAAVTLSPTDKQRVAEIIYKLVYLAPGTEQDDELTYNQSTLSSLTRDPRSICKLVQTTLPRLATTTAVPSSISSRSATGAVRYPNKIILAEQSSAVQAVLHTLATQPGTWLKSGDPLTHLPLHPENILIGDLSMVERLAPQSVDITIGVRSSVYKRGQEWIDLGKAVARSLNKNGIWVDDSIRDNDGYRYRLEELKSLQTALAGVSISFGIIHGPGFPGEDANPIVPLALVMVRGNSVRERIGAAMDDPQYSLEELAA